MKEYIPTLNSAIGAQSPVQVLEPYRAIRWMYNYHISILCPSFENILCIVCLHQHCKVTVRWCTHQEQLKGSCSFQGAFRRISLTCRTWNCPVAVANESFQKREVSRFFLATAPCLSSPSNHSFVHIITLKMPSGVMLGSDLSILIPGMPLK